MFAALDKFTEEALNDARVLERADRKFSAAASGTLLFSGHFSLVSGGVMLVGAGISAALGAKDLAAELAAAGGTYVVGAGIFYAGNKLIRAATVPDAKKILVEREAGRQAILDNLRKNTQASVDKINRDWAERLKDAAGKGTLINLQADQFAEVKTA